MLVPAGGPRPTSSHAEKAFYVAELEPSETYAVRMYIALTRATAQAIGIGTEAQIDADPRLA